MDARLKHLGPIFFTGVDGDVSITGLDRIIWKSNILKLIWDLIM